MTPQERNLLQSLAERIGSTQVPDKDPEAQAFILQKIGTKPDALYILTQTVLIQEMALNQANKRLHELSEQQAAPAPSQPTSFLGRLFGSSAPTPPPPQYYQEPVYQQPVYQQNPGGVSSFLRSAAATATGVAAGALAFEGIESLFGHHGYGGFGGDPFLGGGGEFVQGAPSETIINNYYDDSNSGATDRFSDAGTSSDFSSDTSSDTSFDSSTDDASSDYSQI